jgi:dTDP-4-amino-4,6-dideoxygalactose transaminase
VEALEATGLPWVEDCATSPFTRTTRGWAGTAGWAGIYSFGSTKYVTGGGGGAIVLRGAAVEGWDAALRWAGTHHALGDLNAGLALAQWERGSTFLARRRAIAEAYDTTLVQVGIRPVERAEGHSVFRYLVRTPGPAEAVREQLVGLGVDARTSINPWLYDDPDVGIVARPARGDAWYHWNGHLLSVPIYPALDDGAIATVCEALARAVSP